MSPMMAMMGGIPYRHLKPSVCSQSRGDGYLIFHRCWARWESFSLAPMTLKGWNSTKGVWSEMSSARLTPRM